MKYFYIFITIICVIPTFGISILLYLIIDDLIKFSNQDKAQKLLDESNFIKDLYKK
jgi:hypothetical protein